MKSLDAQQAKALKLMKKSDSIRLAIKKGRKNLIHSNAISSVDLAISMRTSKENVRISSEAVSRRESKVCQANTLSANEDLDAVYDHAEKEKMMEEAAPGAHIQEEAQSLLAAISGMQM